MAADDTNVRGAASMGEGIWIRRARLVASTLMVGTSQAAVNFRTVSWLVGLLVPTYTTSGGMLAGGLVGGLAMSGVLAGGAFFATGAALIYLSREDAPPPTLTRR